MAPPDANPPLTAPAGRPSLSQLESRVQVFTCTFCWHISSAPPHVVGRSARLACEACYNALLDLSICWVCGEVVLRGDDCVSLGWCFWHKACYGCLICGSRLLVHGVTVKELFEVPTDEKDTEEGDGLVATRGRAVEIGAIPLCAHCYVGVGAEEMDSQTVVDGALRRMDYKDGGLSRKRHDGDHIRDARPRSEHHQGLGDMFCPVPLESTIYVSVQDPTGQPAFKPSPTKPIPRWMAAAPSHANETVDHGRHLEWKLDERPRHPSIAELSLRRRLSSSASTERLPKPRTPTPEILQPTTSPDAAVRLTSPTIVTPEPIPIDVPKVFRYNRIGFIDFESLKRPSSRLDRIREESSHADSRTPSPYLTPPEWPPFLYGDRPDSPEPLQEPVATGKVIPSDGACVFSDTSSRTRPSSVVSPSQTPTPSQSRRLQASAHASDMSRSTRLPRKSTMLRAKIAAHHPSAGQTALPMSSEFLDRYGLVQGRETPKPSALLKKTPPSSRRPSRETEPIVARMAKNSRSVATTGLVDETTVVTATADSDAPKQFSLDRTTGSIAHHDGPASDRSRMGRRRSLQVELRRLFTG